MKRELNIICSACDKPLGDSGDLVGNLWVSHAEVTAHMDSRLGDEKAGPKGYMDIANSPRRARWRANHLNCDDGVEADMYSIPSYEIRTWADLATWTAQLMGKRWIVDTNWSAVLRGVASGESKLIVRVAQRTA